MTTNKQQMFMYFLVLTLASFLLPGCMNNNQDELKIDVMPNKINPEVVGRELSFDLAADEKRDLAKQINVVMGLFRIGVIDREVKEEAQYVFGAPSEEKSAYYSFELFSAHRMHLRKFNSDSGQELNSWVLKLDEPRLAPLLTLLGDAEAKNDQSTLTEQQKCETLNSLKKQGIFCFPEGFDFQDAKIIGKPKTICIDKLSIVVVASFSIEVPKDASIDLTELLYEIENGKLCFNSPILTTWRCTKWGGGSFLLRYAKMAPDQIAKKRQMKEEALDDLLKWAQPNVLVIDETQCKKCILNNSFTNPTKLFVLSDLPKLQFLNEYREYSTIENVELIQMKWSEVSDIFREL